MPSLTSILTFLLSSVLAAAQVISSKLSLDETQIQRAMQMIKSSIKRKAAKKAPNLAKSSCGKHFKEKNVSFLFGCEGMAAANPTQTYCLVFREIPNNSTVMVYGVGFFSLNKFVASSYSQYFLPEDDGYMLTSFTIWFLRDPITDPSMLNPNVIASNGVGYLQVGASSYLSTGGVYTFPNVNDNDCGVSAWKTFEIDWFSSTFPLPVPFDVLGTMTVYS